MLLRQQRNRWKSYQTREWNKKIVRVTDATCLIKTDEFVCLFSLRSLLKPVDTESLHWQEMNSGIVCMSREEKKKLLTARLQKTHQFAFSFLVSQIQCPRILLLNESTLQLNKQIWEDSCGFVYLFLILVFCLVQRVFVFKKKKSQQRNVWVLSGGLVDIIAIIVVD